MTIRNALIVFTLLLCGCSTLATREAAIGCQAADIATTYRALHMNPNAYETSQVPLNALVVIKLALITFIALWKEWDEASEDIRAAITIIGCAPVPGNLKAAKG